MADATDFINPTTGEIDTAGLMTAYTEKCEEAAALDYKFRQSARSEVALRKELAKTHANDPRSAQIREVMEYWLVKLHKSSRTKIPMDGVRAQKVRSRLNQDFTVDDLKLAVDGAAKKPFVGPRGRVATQEPGCRREDDLELILRDEKNVERFQSYAREAEQAEKPAETPPVLVAVPDPPREQRPQQRRPNYGERVRSGEMPPVDLVLYALNEAGCDWRAGTQQDSWSAVCPAHDDSSPSLAVHRKPDGMVLLYCFAGCDTDDVLRVLGLEWRDLWTNCERDREALEYRAPGERRLPAHLRHAMSELLDREERQAA